MYLACTLKGIGYDLIAKTKTEGPDMGSNANSSRIWIEAVAARPGQGADKIPLPRHDEIGFRVPEEQIVLRYTTAIDAKYKQHIHYREKNIVAKSEPYIIAVNGNKVPYAWDDEIPYIVQAVLPFGLPTVWENWDEPEKSVTGYAHRPEIKKSRNDGAVSTNIFSRGEHEGISGIIFSRVFGIYEFCSEMGRDFIFVHNPLASNKLPEGWLRVGREYRFDKGNSLECRRWSSK